jgi:PAS domain S-box-containing protein
MSTQPEVVILIVDDKEKNLFALERTLREVPARVVKATNGEEALAHCLNHDFSLAILDVQMPGMDGYELAEMMLGDPHTSRIPIIFVTAAYSDEQHLFKGYEAGAVDYIIKPFNPLVLLGKVRVFLELARYRLGLEKLVTERTQALMDREAQYRSLVENACDLIQSVHSDQKINFVNASWKHLLGYRESDLQGLKLLDVLAPEVQKAYQAMVERVMRGHQEVNFPTTLVTRSGNRLHVEGNIVPMIEDGLISGHQAFFRDVTAKKSAERQLQLALDASGVLLWDWNMVTDQIVLIGGGDHPLGMAFSYLSNLDRSTWTQYIHPDDLELRARMLEAHLEFGAACFECELRIRGSEDNWIWVFERGIVIEHQEDGKPLRMAGTLMDVTERKRAEEERARVTRAEAESQAKSRFLASMSHEMRTPLNAILGYAQLLKHESGLSERQRDSLSTIVRSGDHLLSLINEVLDMARIESGTLPVTLSEVKLRELLVDIERMFRLKAQERGLSLKLCGVDHLPRSIHSDARKIRQVLINLLGNAMKFTEVGEITLEAECITTVENMVELSISVSDTGIGIAEEYLESIFESFVQTEEGSRHSGAGLGLAVSRQLARALGGDVTASSQRGVGSRFVFTLVAGSGDLNESVDTTERVVVGLESTSRNQSILVFDKRPEHRLVLLRMLDTIGFIVNDADTLPSLLAACKQDKPSLIIYSLSTAEDSLRELEQLSSECSDGQIPLLAIVSSDLQLEAVSNLSQGVLVMPIHDTELYDAVGQLANVRYVWSGVSNENEELERLKDDQAVRDLADEVKARVTQAVEDGLTDEIAELISSLAEESPRAAARMQLLARNFDYELLLELLSPL